MGVSSHSTRRPCREETSSSSLAVRVRAWRADFSSTPRLPRASSRVAVHTEECRGCTNSPSTVSSSERALAEPTSRRREEATLGSDTALLQVGDGVGGRSGDRSHRIVASGADGPPGMTVDKLLTIFESSVECCAPHAKDEVHAVTVLDTPDADQQAPEIPVVDFDTAPDRYRHWRLDVDGDVATVTLRSTRTPGWSTATR